MNPKMNMSALIKMMLRTAFVTQTVISRASLKREISFSDRRIRKLRRLCAVYARSDGLLGDSVAMEMNRMTSMTRQKAVTMKSKMFQLFVQKATKSSIHLKAISVTKMSRARISMTSKQTRMAAGVDGPPWSAWRPRMIVLTTSTVRMKFWNQVLWTTQLAQRSIGGFFVFLLCTRFIRRSSTVTAFTNYTSTTTKHYTIQYNTIQYNTIQCNTIPYNTVQYSTIQCNIIQCNAIQYNKV